MSSDFDENIVRPGVRRIRRVVNVVETDSEVQAPRNVPESQQYASAAQRYVPEPQQYASVAPRYVPEPPRHAPVTRQDNTRVEEPIEIINPVTENLEVPMERVEATGENASQVISLVSNIERKLANSSASGMIGVFGVNSDIVVRDALNRVRVDYIEMMRITYDMDYNDIYLVIAAKIYNYLERLNRRYRVDSFRMGSIQHNLSEILIDPSRHSRDEFDYLYALAGSQEKASRVRELFSEIKRVYFGNTRQKFIISIEIGPGYFRNDILHKLNNICSSDVVIIVNTLRPQEMESQYLGGSFGSDSLVYMQKYFMTIDTYDCN